MGNKHHISIFVISMPTPRPRRPYRPCACFGKAETFNMRCICASSLLVKSTESCIPRMQPSEELQVRSMQWKRKPEGWSKVFSVKSVQKLLTILVLRCKTFETSLTPCPLSLRQFQEPAAADLSWHFSTC